MAEPKLTVRVLGLVALFRGDLDVTPTGRRPRQVLALLAAADGAWVSSDHLADQLWGDRQPATARSALQVHVSVVRKAGGAEVIVTEGPGYRLNTAFCEIDAARFDRLWAEGRRALDERAHRSASALLAEALDLWRGEPYQGIGEVAGLEAELTRLEESRRHATGDWIETELALGRHHAIVADLERLVDEWPLDERLWSQLALALHRSERHADAVRVFTRAREALAEVGLDLGERMRSLEERILADDPTLVPPAAPEQPGNLPVAHTPFVGRDPELRELGKLIRERPLVTLTGVGGSGKTRMALEVAERNREVFPDGCWWADLSHIAPGGRVEQVVAEAIGVSEPGRGLSALVDHLRTRHLLLVLDNCEHVLPEVTAFVNQLLAVSRVVRVLATSRERIGLAAERVFAVTSLEIPEIGSNRGREVEAVRLFFERAWDVATDLVDDQRNVELVSRIVRSLDGLPLAIELAAARADAVGLDQLASSLDAGERMPGPRPPEGLGRHHSLEAVFDWSYRLLDDDEQRLLRQLSIFQGEWTAPMAASISGVSESWAVDRLARLARKSMISISDRSASLRYRMLRVVRIFAGQRLADAGEMRVVAERHFETMLELAEWLGGPTAQLAGITRLVELERHRDDFLTALSWAQEQGRMVEGLRLAGSLWWLWFRRGPYGEGATRLRAFVEGLDPRPTPELVAALLGLGYLEAVRHRPEEAHIAAERALELAREIGDEGAVADALEVLVVCASLTGDVERVRRLLDERIELVESMGDARRQATTHALRAHLLFDHEPSDLQRELLTEAYRIFGDMDDLWGVSWVEWSRGHLELRAGRHQAAREKFGVVLGICREIRHDYGIRLALVGLALTEALSGSPEQGLRPLVAAERMGEQLQAPIPRIDRQRIDQAWRSICDQLGEEVSHTTKDRLSRIELTELIEAECDRLAVADVGSAPPQAG